VNRRRREESLLDLVKRLASNEESPATLITRVIREMATPENKELARLSERCREHLMGSPKLAEAMMNGMQLASALFRAELQANAIRGSKQVKHLAKESPNATKASARARSKAHEGWIKPAKARRDWYVKSGKTWTVRQIAKEIAPTLGKSWRSVERVIGPALK
jgi:hypothetical protein